MANTKNITWRWCARYIKIRDTVEDFPISQNLELVHCRTCGKWLQRNSKEAQAGHFIGRGLGGSSGVYFDERNLAIQCYQCNFFKQGAPYEYEQFMLKKYGKEVVDELRLKHKIGRYTLKDLVALELYFKSEVERLCKKYNIDKWWIRSRK